MRLTSILLAVLVLSPIALAQSTPQETVDSVREATATEAAPDANDAVHDKLRVLRDNLVEAVNNADIDKVLACLHENVVLTTQHGRELDVSTGRDGVRKYIERFRTGPDRGLDGFHVTPTVDALTILYGDDTGVAYGSSVDHYQLVGGTEFDANTRWSATVVREGEEWLVADLHVSQNVFDNPALDAVRLAANIKAGIVGVGGFLLGLVGARSIARRKSEK